MAGRACYSSVCFFLGGGRSLLLMIRDRAAKIKAKEKCGDQNSVLQHLVLCYVTCCVQAMGPYVALTNRLISFTIKTTDK